MNKGIGNIDGKLYETIGKYLVEQPIVGISSGKISLSYNTKTPYSSIKIRNLGQYPVRFNSGDTYLPFETMVLGTEDIHHLEQDEIHFVFITSGVTAVSNTSSGYTNAYVLEISGVNIRECECKKKC